MKKKELKTPTILLNMEALKNIKNYVQSIKKSYGR